MADFRVDQAAGLRRLFGGSQLQVVSFASGCNGVGRSGTIANIACALARLGKEVLVIDEQGPGDDIAASFGLLARYDLLHVLQRERRLGEVLIDPLPGLRILPAARTVKKLGKLTLAQQQTFLDAMGTLERPVDIILVDAATGYPQGLSPLALAAQETVLVLSGSSESITEAYALMKRLSQGYSRKQFRVLINKVRSEPDARSIFDNIAQVAAQRRIARLQYIGSIPYDETLRQSAQLCRPVVVHAPDAASARACREIAGDMLYWPRAESDPAGVESFVQQLLHLSQRIPTIASRA